MYKLYQEFCIDKQELPVKESYYRHICNTEFACGRCDNLQNIIRYSTNENVIKNAKQTSSCTKERPRKKQMPKKLILLKIKMILKLWL
ncbi:unnamed protein product [Acanthoscelides obtectus]|uniref:Uncharacterized protein n=1 Tax=Acanthoscelides obtectus TaxID=200917 RepID=A0A9P0LTG3_ACAOB|nr:unnamed protein product [Acanthoscelides obtectus]CAK1683308.1 hypothetical protein AOBTE_LOCUS34196 [Acanthoscelides obtectus]